MLEPMEHGYLYELLRKVGLSDFQAGTFEFLLVRPLKILLIVVAVVVLARLGSRAIRRFVLGIHARSPLLATSARAEQRAATISHALSSFVRGVVWVVGGLLVLDQIGLNLAPLLAGAGIAGVAIGFGAQSLVRDYLSGLFILLEDQYGVGDNVNVGTNAVGRVEDVNLRVTRVRSADGVVWFVPNGEIRTVGNASMDA